MSEPPAGQGVAVPTDVLVQRLPDEELVILNLATEQYFGLDRTAARMWATLTEAGDVERAYLQLRDRFDVEPEVLRRDFDAFVEQLRGRGLLHLSTDTA